MKSFPARTRGIRALALATLLPLLAAGCGYNAIQAQDEEVAATWAEVSNQYQRRADLIPNLVKTVKAAAAQERETLDAVVSARARATSISATPELVNDPAAFEKFIAAQDQLSGALARLMVAVERYPELKSQQGFLDLQAQLEGTENRIAVARGRYIAAVKTYNTTVRSFPSNLTAMVIGASKKSSFTAREGSDVPPEVEF